MLIDLIDFFHLGLTISGFYVCYRAGFEQATSRIIRELEDAGVIKMLDEDDDEK